jgi:hypothetical protein
MYRRIVVFAIIGIGTFLYGKLEKKGVIKEKRNISFIMPIGFLAAVIYYVVRENSFTGIRPPESIEFEIFMIPIVVLIVAMGVFRIGQSMYLRQNTGNMAETHKIMLAEDGFDVERRIRDYKILGFMHLICAGLISLIVWHIVPFLWQRV